MSTKLPAPRSRVSMKRLGPAADELARRRTLRGKPLPPTERRGDTWSLVRPAHHKNRR
jgi:hypothetical protein